MRGTFRRVTRDSRIAVTRARLATWTTHASYTQKWLVLGSVIGLISGVGAVVFYRALVWANQFFLIDLGGYRPPTPYSEGLVAASTHFTRPWAIPLVAGLGALLGALLVRWFAPDASGHGTDAAIAAVHHNPRGIRLRTVAVKIVASALTIGSGGSGGREGPTGQISAGFGSFLARLLDLSPSDARVTVASGVGSGIGAIFGAPLGGALLAAEIMYRDDFEVEALLPSFIASVVGYGVFGSFQGFGPLFGYVSGYHLSNAGQFVWFGLLGVIAGFVGLLYSTTFYGLEGALARVPVPSWVRVAGAGVTVGLLGLVVPETLGTGYGWIQQAFTSQLLALPLWVVLALPFVRILATSLSIGSGGSGGIFGPGMVIGAFVGAAWWRLLEGHVAGVPASPAPFVIVGMMACFGSIARAPIAMMLMVAEMTGTLTMVVPGMLAVGVASLVVRRGDHTIYRSQIRSRAESPAHRMATGLPLLASMRVEQALAAPRCVVSESLAIDDAARALDVAHVHFAPVIDDESRYAGTIVREALDQGNGPLSERVTNTVVPLQRASALDVALEAMTATPLSWSPVLDENRRVVGTISISDVVRAYRFELSERVHRASALDGSGGFLDLVLSPDSPLVGHVLSESGLPRGVLLIALEREGRTTAPSGETQFRPGDRLFAVGAPDELNHVRRLAAPAAPTTSDTDTDTDTDTDFRP